MKLHKKASDVRDNDKRGIENSAKTLLANIRFMSVDNPVRTVVITSTIPNEGKTFVAANLARAMATSGIRTLLVECDMRRRSMANTLGTHARHGMYSVVSGEVSLADAVVPTGTQRLHFLDAEPHIPNPSDLLSSRRFNALIEEAKKEFGYIVFDTPPVGTFVDAAVLGAKVDAVFMVVREQFARRDEIARAADQLKTANVPLSGIVMNFCERQSSEYYYEYYYREGDSDRRESSGRDDAQAFASAGDWQADDTGAFLRGTDTIPTETVGSARMGTPQSWGNAPDMDEPPATGAAVGAPSSDGRARDLHLSVPSLGETGVISRADLRKRI